MALPTQYTAGYTLYAGKVSCVCLAAWLPWLERLCRAHGYIGKTSKLTVLQLTGSYELSGGTHAGGGVYDIKQYDSRIVRLAREMGAPATWLRNMNYPDGSPGNTHTHGVLSGCPHNSQARYQITAQRRGYNGMGQGWYGGQYLWGYGGKDQHPDPSVYRTFAQGIAWAQAEIVRLTGQQILDKTTEDDDMFSDEDRKDLQYVSQQVKVTDANSFKRDEALAEAVSELAEAIKALPINLWNVPVLRDGVKVPVIQEVADAHTAAQRALDVVAKLTQP